MNDLVLKMLNQNYISSSIDTSQIEQPAGNRDSLTVAMIKDGNESGQYLPGCNFFSSVSFRLRLTSMAESSLMIR